MKKLLTFFEIELKLAIREFSGVLFGLILPTGIMILLGIIYGDKAAFEGATFSLVQQSFPAVATIGICATGLMGIPLTISAYREKKVLKHFKVTPTSPILLLGAQVLTNLVFAMISTLFVLAAAVFLFNYRMVGNIGSFILSYSLVLTAIYSIGLMIASISKNMKTANLLTSLVYFPMFFLSGATIPFEIMPKGLQQASAVMPLTQGIILLKNVSLNISNGTIVKPVIVLAATALICTAIALKIFRWE